MPYFAGVISRNRAKSFNIFAGVMSCSYSKESQIPTAARSTFSMVSSEGCEFSHHNRGALARFPKERRNRSNLLIGRLVGSTDCAHGDRLMAMKDQDPLDLAAYRSAKNREQRTAALARWKPSPVLMAWSALIAFAAVTYFAFGSSNRFSTADLTGTIAGSGGIAECGLIRRTCLVDGDTGWQDGTKWRLQGIDAPEMDDKAECESERVKAVASLQRLTELMAPGYSIKGSGKNDRLGRALVDVTVKDGRDAGKLLIAEGLAQPWPNTGNVWCGR